MADLFVCRVTYTKTIDTNKYGNGSSMYAFKTTSFSNAESLAYTKAKAETNYYTNAKVTSIKRKNLSALDDLNVTTTGTNPKPYLYRASVTNLKDSTDTENIKYISVSFVFPSSAEPSAYDPSKLNEDLAAHLSGTVYSLSSDEGKLSSVKYSYELSRKKIGADE